MEKKNNTAKILSLNILVILFLMMSIQLIIALPISGGVNYTLTIPWPSGSGSGPISATWVQQFYANTTILVTGVISLTTPNMTTPPTKCYVGNGDVSPKNNIYGQYSVGDYVGTNCTLNAPVLIPGGTYFYLKSDRNGASWTDGPDTNYGGALTILSDGNVTIIKQGGWEINANSTGAGQGNYFQGSVRGIQYQLVNWSDNNLPYRKIINITGPPSNTLTNFPVLINVSYFSGLQSDFDDVRFSSLSGAPLSYELNNKVDGIFALYWVKIPSLATGTNQIYIYYGNSSYTNGETKTEVWANNYLVSYHFEGNALDSSPRANNGSLTGAPATVNGTLGAGLNFSTPGTTYMYSGSNLGISGSNIPWTVAWVSNGLNQSTTTYNYHWAIGTSANYPANTCTQPAARSHADTDYTWGLPGYGCASMDPITWNASNTGIFAANLTHYHVITYNGTYVRWWIDGVEMTPSATPTVTFVIQDSPLKIAHVEYGNPDGNIRLDDMQVMNVSQGADYAIRTYQNLNQSLVTFGSQEPLYPTPTTITLIYPPNNAIISNNITGNGTTNFTANITSASANLTNATLYLSNPITWSSNLNTNLLLYYNFEETSGTNIIDRANGLYNGTRFNATQNVTGIVGKAYSYPGGSWSNITSIFPNNTLNRQNWTVNMWIKFGHVSGSENIAWTYQNKANGFNPQIQVRINAGGSWNIYSSAWGWTPGYAPPANTWQMVSLTQFNNASGDFIEVYVNGTRVLASAKGSYLLESDFHAVGMDNVFFNGSFDEYGIWSRRLSASEIQQLYNNGIGITDTYYTPVSTVTISSVTTYLLGIPVALVEGVYNWFVTAYDETVTSTTSSINQFQIDNQPPVLNVVYPIPGGNYSNITYFQFNVTHPQAITSCNYSLNNGITNQTVPGFNGTSLGTGLLSYWTLDVDGTDNYGNKNLTAVGTPTLITNGSCKKGSCYYFDGNSYFQNATASTGSVGYPIGQNASTFSMWIKSSETVNVGYFLQYGVEANKQDRRIYKYQSASIYSPTFSGGGILYTNPTILYNNTWHNIVLITNGTTQQLWLDGINVANATNFDGNTQVGSITLASDGSGQGYNFNGYLDEVGIWNRTLNASEINTLYTQSYNTNNCVGINTVSDTPIYQGWNNFTAYATDGASLATDTHQYWFDNRTPSSPILISPTNNSYSGSPTIFNASIMDNYPGLGLIGYWSLDVDGTDKIDSKNLVAVNSPQLITSGCKYGNCYYFNGSNYFVNGTAATGSIGFPLGKNASTVSLWYKTNDTSANVGMFFTYGPATSLADRRVYRYTTSIYGVTSSGGGFIVATSTYNNTWHNAVIVNPENSVAQQLWIDGVNVANATDWNGNTQIGKISIGSDAAGSNFVGYLDEVGIWNRTLSASEIQTIYNNSGLSGGISNATVYVYGNRTSPQLSTGLIGYWAFTEGSGTLTTDSTGQQMNASVNAKWTTGIIPGHYAINFNQTANAVVNLTMRKNLTESSPLSVSFWFNTPGRDGNYMIGFNKKMIDPSAGGTNDWNGLQIESQLNDDGQQHPVLWAGLYSYGGASTKRITTLGNHTPFGTWHHYVVVYNGTVGAPSDYNYVFYQDGVQVSPPWYVSSTYPGTPSFNVDTLTMGGFSGPGVPLSGGFYGIGNMTEVGVWNRTLSQSEVTQLYNNGAGLTYPFYSNQLINQTTVTYNQTTPTYQTILSVPIALVEGVYSWFVKVFDFTGNSAISQQNYTVNIDTAYPQIQFTPPTPTNNSYIKNNWIFVNVSASDTNEANMNFSLYYINNTIKNSTILGPGNRTFNWTNIADGNYSFIVSITDLAGNTNNTGLRYVMVDTVAPSAIINYPTNNTWVKNNTVNMSYNVSFAGNNVSSCSALGGNVTVVDGKCIHVFTTNGTFTASSNINATILIVAGGGGGGRDNYAGIRGAGAGGAGGLIYNNSYPISSGLTNVVVGVGGAGGINALNITVNGRNGTNSSFGTLQAMGGGGGLGHYSSLQGDGWFPPTGAFSGGSGGGGIGSGIGGPPGNGTAGQGNNGGWGYANNPYAGGGGGGAGAIGVNGSATNGGNGGVGLQYSISGTSTYYAGGGGAVTSSGTQGIGGLGGGGNASSNTNPGGNGVNGTGGGGAGASNAVPGSGGSGIVIISYPVSGGSALVNSTMYIYNVTSSVQTWANNNFNKRKTINIQGGSETLTNFPVLVNITYAASMNADFSDLRFYSGNCNSGSTQSLAYEINNKVNSNFALVWINIPTLTTGSNSICMYYGNPSATSAENKTAVWSNNYLVVYHFEGNALDSSPRANNGTVTGSPATVNATIGSALNFSTAGSTYMVSQNNLGIESQVTTKPWTVSWLANALNNVSTDPLSYNWQWAMGTDANYPTYGCTEPAVQTHQGAPDLTWGLPGYGCSVMDNIRWNSSAVPPFEATATLYHTVVYNGTFMRWYINGIEMTPTGSGAPPYVTWHIQDSPLKISNALFAGINGVTRMDEFQVQNISQNASWAVRSYQNINQSMNTFGTEETSGSSIITLVNQTTTTSFSDMFNTVVSIPVGLVDATYQWFIDVFDFAGNKGVTSNTTFVVDTTYPSIQFISPTLPTGTNASQTFITAKVNITEVNNFNLTFRLNGVNYNGSLTGSSSTSTLTNPWLYGSSSGDISAGSFWKALLYANQSIYLTGLSVITGMTHLPSICYVGYGNGSVIKSINGTFVGNNCTFTTPFLMQAGNYYSAYAGRYDTGWVNGSLSNNFDPLDYSDGYLTMLSNGTWCDLTSTSECGAVYNYDYTAINSYTYQTSSVANTYTWTGLPNGQYIYSATTCDIENQCNSTEQRTIMLDTVAPNVTLINPISGYGSWTKRKPITVTEMNGTSLTDYSVRIFVPWVSGMNSNFSDLRFTDINGNTLNSYLELYNNGANVTAWVKVPSIPASSSITLYMYYGNPSAPDISNIATAFLVGDDFNTFNTTMWDCTGTTCTINNGTLELTTTSDVNSENDIVYKLSQFFDVSIETRWKSTMDSGYSTNLVLRRQSNDGSIQNTGRYVAMMSYLATNTNNPMITYATTGGQGSGTVLGISGTAFPVYLFPNTWFRESFSGYLTQLNNTRNNDNGVSNSTVTAYDGNLISGYAALGRQKYTGTSTFDWVRIRNYVPREPTATLGSEQNTSSITKYVTNSIINFTWAVNETGAGNPITNWSDSQLSSGLVGYWSFDTMTNSNTQFPDAFGLRNGTVVNRTYTADWSTNASCKIGRCVYFNNDGSGAQTQANVNISNVAGLFNVTKNFTVSFWIYPTVLNPQYNTYMGSHNYEPDMLKIFYSGIGPGIGKVSLYARDSSGNPMSSYGENTTTLINNWYNLVVVYNGDKNASSIKYYMNGNLTTTVTTENTLTGNDVITKFAFGSNPLGDYGYTGYMDEVGIWNRSLSASDISSLYNNGTGIGYPTNLSTGSGIKNTTVYVTNLVSQWPQYLNNSLLASYNFNEGSGTKVIDLYTGQKNITAYVGNLIWNSTSVSGQSLSIDPSNTAANINNFTFTETTPFTFSFWFYRKNDAGQTQFIGSYPTGSVFDAFTGITFYDQNLGTRRSFATYLCSDNGASNWGPLGCIQRETNYVLPVGQWVHVVSTYNGSKTMAGVKIYFNGTEASYDVVNSLDGLTGTFTKTGIILGSGDSSYTNNYLIDDLNIWNRTLNASEITALYNNQAGLYYRPYSSGIINQTTVTQPTIGNLFNAIIGMPITLVDGIYGWFADAYDYAGNYFTSSTKSFTLDTTYPQISFIAPTQPNNTYVNQNYVTANVSLNETNAGNITFSLYGNFPAPFQNVSSYSCSGTFDPAHPCTNSFDNNWSSYAYPLPPSPASCSGNIAFIYLNYTFNKANQYINYTFLISGSGPNNDYDVAYYFNNDWQPCGPFDPYGTYNRQCNIISNTSINQIRIRLVAYNLSDHCFGTGDGTLSTYYEGSFNISTSSGVNSTTFGPGVTNYTWTNLLDGTYQYQVNTTDLAGLSNATDLRTITLDTLAPSPDFVSGTDPNGGYLSKNNIVYNVTVTGGNQNNLTIYLYNRTGLYTSSYYSPGNVSYYNIYAQFNPLPDGTYYMNATACDLANNCGSTPETYTITLDTVAPQIGFISPTLPTGTNVSQTFITAAVNVNETNEANITFYLNNNGTSFNATQNSWPSGLSNGLTAYYNFEENGTNYVSSVSAVNNGTASGITRVNGKVGYAAHCNGVNGTILMNETNNVFDAPSVGDYTISWWEYRSSLNWIIARSSILYSPYLLGADAGGFESMYASSNGGSWGVAGFALTPNASLNIWKNVVLMQNATGLYSYTNGVLVSSTSRFITADSTESLRICNGQGFYSNSTIDELGFWNRSLTVSEIQQLYNSGSGITYSNATNTRNYTWSNLSNGLYTYSVKDCSLTGVCTSTENRTIMLDTINPNITAITPVNIAYLNQSAINFTLAVNDTGGNNLDWSYGYDAGTSYTSISSSGWRAQGFNLTTSKTLDKINLTLSNESGSDNNCMAWISNGVANPGAGSILSLASFNTSSIIGPGGANVGPYYNITIDLPNIVLSANTRYWIVTNCSGDKVIDWKTSTPGTFADGWQDFSQNGGISWYGSDYGQDSDFRLALTGDATGSGVKNATVYVFNGVNSLTTFSNLLTSENISLTSNQSVTRYLSIPQNTIVTNAYLNISGIVAFNGTYVMQNGSAGIFSQAAFGASDRLWIFTYTKPTGYINDGTNKALWQVKHGNQTSPYNITIPDTCDASSPFKVGIDLDGSAVRSQPYCTTDGGTSWTPIGITVTTPGYTGIQVDSDPSKAYDNNYATYVGWAPNAYAQYYISGLGNPTGNNMYEQNIFWPMGSYSNGAFNLSVGSSNVWNNTGLFNGTNQTQNLVNYINNYLATCTYVGGVCNVPFTFYSNSTAGLQYSGIQVTYSSLNQSATATSFSDLFNSIVGIPITLVDGAYSWFADVFDFAGNRATTNVRNFTLDTVPPQIGFISPTLPTGTNASQTYITAAVNVNETNEANITFYLGNTTITFTNGTRTYNWTNLSNRLYSYYVTECSLTGECASTETRTIFLDTVAPNITAITPNASTYLNQSTNNFTWAINESGQGGNFSLIPVNITGNVPGNYSLSLTVPYVTGMNPDFSDIRFSDGSNNLPYWIESYTNYTSALAWVKIQNNNTLYITYGNAGGSQSNFNNAFLYADDFETNTISNYSIVGNCGSPSISGGTLNTTVGGLCFIVPKGQYLSQNYTVEGEMSLTGGSNGYIFLNAYERSSLPNAYWNYIISNGEWDLSDGQAGINFTSGFVTTGVYYKTNLTVYNTGPSSVFLNQKLLLSNGTVIGLTGVSSSYSSGNYSLGGYVTGGSPIISYRWWRVIPYAPGVNYTMGSAIPLRTGTGIKNSTLYIYNVTWATTLNWGKRTTLILNNYPNQINLTYLTGMNADFSDIRFYLGECAVAINPVQYKISSSTPSVSAIVWLANVSSTNKVCMYYNNPLASSTQNASLIVGNSSLTTYSIGGISTPAGASSENLVNQTIFTSFTDMFNTLISLPVALADGTYKWFADVFDFAGNKNTTQNQSFVVDTITPGINFVSPTNPSGTKTNAGLPVNISVVDMNPTNISIYVYNNTNYPCYQETANASTAGDGNCMLAYTGNYSCPGGFCNWGNYSAIYDGSWSTSSASTATVSEMIVNYTKPMMATGGMLQFKNGITTQNISINQSCWNANPNQVSFLISSDTNGIYTTTLACYNGVDYSTIMYTASDLSNVSYGDFYEEAMVWNISTLINTTTNYNNNNLYVNFSLINGIYYYRADTYDYTGKYNLTSVRNATVDIPPNISYPPYQIPFDLTSNNSFSVGLNTTWNITATGGSLNQSSIRIYYMTNKTSSPYNIYINGTGFGGWNNGTYVNYTNDSYVFFFSDNQIYPATYNLPERGVELTPHQAWLLNNNTEWAKIELLNFSNKDTYNQYEIMANATSNSSGNAQVYYCNSTYVSGDPSGDGSCTLIATISPDTPFNHCHNPGYSCHDLIPVVVVPFDVNTGLVNNQTVVTSRSQFLFSGGFNGSWNVYYVPNASRSGAAMTSTDNAGSWTDQGTNFTFDSHMHIYDGTDMFQYYVNASTIYGGTTKSTTKQDLIDLGGLPPSPPNINVPTAGYYRQVIPINYDPSVSPSGNQLLYYNITLLNPNAVYNKSIIENNSLNTSYNWNTTTTTDGNYLISVRVYDNQSLTSFGTSEQFTIDNTYPLISYNNGTTGNNSYINTSMTYNVSVSDLYLSNVTVTLYFNSNPVYSNVTSYSGNTSDIVVGGFPFPMDGVYTFNAVVCDYAGNCNTTDTRTVTYDTTYPLISYSGGTLPDYTNVSQSFIYVNTSVIETNPLNIIFTLNNLTGNVNTTNYSMQDQYSNTTINWTGLPDNKYTYYVTIIDKEGNTNSTPVRNIMLDTNAPSATLLSPTNDSYIDSATNNFTANISDNLGIKNATLKIYNPSDTLVSSTTITYASDTLNAVIGIPITLTDNVYHWFYQVFDWAGNVFNTQNNTLTVDTVNPVLTFASPSTPAGGPYSVTSISVNASATDTNLLLIYTNLTLLVGGSPFSDSYTLTPTATPQDSLFHNWTGLSQGIYNLSAYAIDKAGNNVTISRMINIDTEPPTMNYTYPTPNSTTHTPKTFFTINVTADDPNFVSQTIYYWYQTGSVNTQSVFAKTNTLLQQNLSDGVYYFNASAVDGAGRTAWLETRNITVEYRNQNVSVCKELYVQGGNYHILTNLISDNSTTVCLNVTAADVTIDCMGHTVTGGPGILITKTGAELINCHVSAQNGTALAIIGNSPASINVFNSSFDNAIYGIYVAPEGSITANFVNLYNNKYGIYLNNSNNGNVFTNMGFTSNYDDSMTFINSSSNRITNFALTSASDNSSDGVFHFISSSDNIFTGCDITESAAIKIWGLQNYSVNNSLYSCLYPLGAIQESTDLTSQLLVWFPFTASVVDKVFNKLDNAIVSFVGNETIDEVVPYAPWLNKTNLTYGNITGIMYTNDLGLATTPVMQYMNVFGHVSTANPYHFTATLPPFTPAIALITTGNSGNGTYYQFVLSQEIASSSLSRTAMWIILGIIFLIGVAASIGFFMVRMREGYSVVDIWKYFIILVIWLTVFTIIYFVLAWFIMGSYYPVVSPI